MVKKKRSTSEIYSLYPTGTATLLRSSGSDLVDRVGIEVIKEIVYSILCGENLRNSTEKLTRQRIGLMNGATLSMFVKGAKKDPSFIQNLLKKAHDELMKNTKKEERWVLEWILGLTDKGFQNILRDKPSELERYVTEYIEASRLIASMCEKDYGNLKGILTLDTDNIEIDWEFITKLLRTIGSQTLAIRGSEKSTYGKLFERLVLGSILSILGFKLISKDKITDFNKVFWLSERKEKRESDATALIKPGKGIRFDIGFIGRGNPEISLDKVSRFEREIEMGRQRWYLATIVLVDRIGKKSRIEELAKRINATIIQMSMSYWPKLLANCLNEQTGFRHELIDIPDEEIGEYIWKKMKDVPFDKILGKSKANQSITDFTH